MNKALTKSNVGTRGYVFSLLIAVLLGFFMLTMQYYLIERPEPELFSKFQAARDQGVKTVVSDLADDLIEFERSASILVEQQFPMQNRATEVTQWNEFLVLYTNNTLHNITLDATNSSSLSTRFRLRGTGTDYVIDGDECYLNHTGDYLLINNTVGTVNSTNCSLDIAGSVETRIIVDGYDSGAKYTTPGTNYSCFFNFSGGEEFTIEINADNNVFIDYSSAPTNFTQRIGFESDTLNIVLDSYNESMGANPGWSETFPGNKTYGTVVGMNFVLSDSDSNGVYDYVFVDVNANSVFDDDVDRLYLKQGIVGLGGKVFYIRFDLAGNWLAIDNALGAYTENSWKGVGV